MNTNVAIHETAEWGDWFNPIPVRDVSKGRQSEESVDNNHITKSKSTFRISSDTPLVVSGRRINVHQNEMIPNQAYTVSVGGKHYMLIKGNTGAIDVYELVK